MTAKTDARVMTDSSGNVAGRTDLYPYGEVRSETGSGTKYKMTGKERDSESGNDFFGARYYFNGTGRWLGVDPIIGEIFDPQRLNRYSYSLNDAVNYIDPDGAELVPVCRYIHDGEGGQRKVCDSFKDFKQSPLGSRTVGPLWLDQLSSVAERLEITFRHLANGAIQTLSGAGSVAAVSANCGASLLAVYDALPGTGPLADAASYVATVAQLAVTGEMNVAQLTLATTNFLLGLTGTVLPPGFSTIPELATLEAAALAAGASVDPFSLGAALRQTNPAAIAGGLVGAIVSKAAPAFGNQILENCGVQR